MAQRNSRYEGTCLHCLTNTCFPKFRHAIEGGCVGNRSGVVGQYNYGIVWTCMFCGMDMFWYVERTSYSMCHNFEWVIWNVSYLDRNAQSRDDWDYGPRIKVRGCWFQKVSSRIDGLSRFGEVWTSLDLGFNDGDLEYSGDHRLEDLPFY